MEQKLLRRQSRENAFLVLFSAGFAETLQEAIDLSREGEEYALDEFGEKTVRDYDGHAEEVDALIEERLQGWTMKRLPRVTLTLLRLAVAEMLYGQEKKPAVAINEAVELAKKYGGDDDYQFVNGLLGRVVRDLKLETDQA